MKTISRRTFIKACGVAGVALSQPAAWGAEKSTSLFDGKTLTGWHKPPKKIGHGTGGHWWVEDGLLMGEQDPPGSGNVGHLRGEMPGAFAMKPFQIFQIPGGDGKPTGFTTKVDPRAEKWPPNVYEYTCTAEQWLKAWRVNDWNSARIRCVGKYPQITTWVNDLKVCHWNGETCPLPEYDKDRVFGILGREGSIALQIHGGPKAWPKGKVCRWRNLEIKRL